MLDVLTSYTAVATSKGIRSSPPRMANIMRNEPTISAMAANFHPHTRGNRHHTCHPMYAMPSRGSSMKIIIQTMI